MPRHPPTRCRGFLLPTDPQSITPLTQNKPFKLSYLARVFAIVWAAAGPWMVAWAILLVVQGLLPVALVYLTKPLVDGMQAAVGHGRSWESVEPVLLVAIAIG